MPDTKPATRDLPDSVPNTGRMHVRMLPPTEWPASHRYSPSAWRVDGSLRQFVIDEWGRDEPIPCTACWEAQEVAARLNGRPPVWGGLVDPQLAAMLGRVGR